MNKYFKFFFLGVFDQLHLSVRRRIPVSSVKGLLGKLYPIETCTPLIRMGPDSDGGYLLPDDLEGIKACFSPGVDLESRFELQLAEMGISVFLADFSVEQPKQLHSKFHFTKKYVGAIDHGRFMSMDTWLDQSLAEDSGSDLILQMDIEGFEYETVFSISQKQLKRFRIMVIEVHGFDHLFDRTFFKMVNRFFEKLLVDHSVVHIHPNNFKGPKIIEGIDLYSCLEFTFYRNDRIIGKPSYAKLPNVLDKDNVASNMNRALSKEWYK